MIIHLLLVRLDRDSTRDDNSLDTRNLRREYQALVIAVDHDHNANRPGTQTPAVLPHIQLLLASRIIGVLDDDVEHLGAREVLTETMGSCTLDTASGSRDEALHGRRVQSTCELLLLGLDTGNDRDSEKVLVYFAVELEDLTHFRVGFRLCEVSGVSFLPEEFACAEERLRVLELPSDDAVPLIQFQRKVAMTLDPFRVV